MLLQFNMTNAMSFKEEAILDMVAEKDNLHEDNLISFKGDRVLPAVAIYGANASGKSNAKCSPKKTERPSWTTYLSE